MSDRNNYPSTDNESGTQVDLIDYLMELEKMDGKVLDEFDYED